MAVLDWVVVGGGPHGVCAARALRSAGAELQIVEPSGELLHRWSHRSQAVAMTWMRSPVGHHLGRRPADLHHFLHRPEHADVAALARPLLRPSHAAFVRHARHVIAEHRLHDAVIPGRVEDLRPDGGHWLVQGPGLELRARRVLVATGSNRPRIPDWAQALRRDGAPVHHVFERDAPPARDIVGAGISAVQRALEVRRSTGARVRLWVRHPLSIADFEFDRDWSTARFIGWFSKLDPSRRHAFCVRHAPRGSVPVGLSRRLRKAVRRGHIELRRGEVRGERGRGSQLRLHADGQTVETDAATLATGLCPERVEGWISRSTRSLGLPQQEGLPCLDSNMHWGQGLYITGPLARLRLGPMASNLLGARWAASLLPGVRMQPG